MGEGWPIACSAGLLGPRIRTGPGPEHDFTTTKRERSGVKKGIHYQCR